MKAVIVPFRLALAFTGLVLATSSYGAIVITTNSNVGTGTAFASTAWASQLKNNDLINSGAAGSLAAVNGVVYAGGVDSNMPIGGLNDGGTNDIYGAGAKNTFISASAGNFNQAGNTTAVATFNLNISVNTLGYDITSIQSFMGFGNANPLPQDQANQTYTVAARSLLTGLYTDIATVSYKPFTNTNGTNYESYVSITDNGSGVLASGVDSIRFTFLKPTGALNNTGTVIRELDVAGIATVPEPSSALLGGLGFVGLIARRRRA